MLDFSRVTIQEVLISKLHISREAESVARGEYEART